MRRTFPAKNTKSKPEVIIDKIKHIFIPIKDKITGTFGNIYHKIYALELNSNIVLGVILAVMFILLTSGLVIMHNLNASEINDSSSITVANAESNTDITKSLDQTSDTDVKNNLPIEKAYVTKITAQYTGDTKAGINIDTDQIVVKATLSDNSKQTLQNTQVTFNMDNDVLSYGDNTIQIQYNNLFTDLVINIPKSPMLENTEQYQDEFDNAIYNYQTDTLWITINKEFKKDPYWIIHVICADGNVPYISMNENTYKSLGGILHNEEINHWIVGTCATQKTASGNMPEGLYINNSILYHGDTTSGNEICITSDGSIFSPPQGLSYENLLDMNVIDTTISANPLLINNGEPCEISNSNATNTKTIIAMVEPGEYYMISATNNSYVNENTYTDLQNILLELGCTYAKALAGGVDTTAAFNGKLFVEPPCSNRKIVDVFAFKD